MTKKSVKAEVKAFVKGLITEASPLNFPENASVDEQNFELLANGTRQRRLGLTYEPGYTGKLSNQYIETIPTSNISTYVWRDVAGVDNKNFLVVQSDNTLYFYDLSKSTLSTDGFVGFKTLLNTFSAGKKHSFASVEGLLVVATGNYDIGYVSFDPTLVSFNVSYYNLMVRDFWGVEEDVETTDVYYRPTIDSANHRYNLYNQSWGVPRRWEGAGEKQFTDPVSYYFAYSNVYPSSSETVWTAMTMKAATDPYEYMRPNAWGEVFGSTPTASKGYFIIDLLKRGSSRTKAVENNYARFQQMTMQTYTGNLDYTPGGAKIVTEFAGRIFYAGFSGEVVDGDSRSPNLSSYVAFSRLVRSKNDLGICYQEGDPTSREGSDVVDTDGGVIRLSGAQGIVGMEQIGQSLIVFANNGIWAITGGNDYGFSATNYKAPNISSFGCVSEKSIVKVGDTVLFWGTNGIYSVGRNQTGDLVVKSITDETIQTFYANISPDEKDNAIGVYDDVSKTVRWIYFEFKGFGTQTTVKEIILDTRLGAFYPYVINNPSTGIIRSVFALPQSSVITNTDVVSVGSEKVYVNTDSVVIPFQIRSPSKTGVKYLMLYDDTNSPGNIYFTFGYYTDQSFKDWGSIDAEAYLLTGAITAGDSSVDKQVPYVTVHCYRTENGVDSNFNPIGQSSCLMRSHWGWANSLNSNKWGPEQQVYRYVRGYMASSTVDPYDNGFELITTKNKLRGQGKAIALHFKTETGKDCRIVGWNININGNSVT